jgi:hypothetical protein
MSDRRKWSMPLWVPNPLDSIILFVSEALIVLTFALVALGIAVVALWLL